MFRKILTTVFCALLLFGGVIVAVHADSHTENDLPELPALPKPPTATKDPIPADQLIALGQSCVQQLVFFGVTVAIKYDRCEPK